MHNASLSFFVEGFALVLCLYGIKTMLFRSIHSGGVLLASLLLVLNIAIPLAWLISPDWHNPNVRQIANWIGTPLMLLTVPLVSFVFDYFRGIESLGSTWRKRTFLEVFVGVPVWALSWIGIEIIVLHWSSLS